jgi:cytochrome c oxidase subunit 3
MNKDQSQPNVVSSRKFRLKDIENMHPHQMLLYLSMIGIGLVFIFLMAAFGVSIYDNPARLTIRVPKLFIVSTLLIILSSYLLQSTRRDLVADQIRRVLYRLIAVLVLGGLFCATQIAGWQELHESGVTFQGNVAGTYLYFLSGVHLVHLLGGMLLLLIQTVHLFIAAKDPVRQLLTVTNPYEALKIRMMTQYWHLMDILWVILFVYFLFIF